MRRLLSTLLLVVLLSVVAQAAGDFTVTGPVTFNGSTFTHVGSTVTATSSGVTCSGCTTNKLPKVTGASALGNSTYSDDGTNDTVAPTGDIHLTPGGKLFATIPSSDPASATALWMAPGGFVCVSGSTCSTAGGVASVSNSDGSLTISPTTGAVVASFNPSKSYDFSGGTQTFGPVQGGQRTQAGTSETLSSADCGGSVTYTSNSPVTVTTFASATTSGHVCSVVLYQHGTGTITINDGIGATHVSLACPNGQSAGQYGVMNWWVQGSAVSEWNVGGQCQ